MNFERFVRISKVDPEKRMVYGYASTPDLDSQGERVTLKAIEDSLEDYMRFANIREMHQPSAVGKTKSAEVDEKGLYIGAKVVDDVAWLKVKEGVYSGFSIGGEVVSKVDDEIRALRLYEISLVDRPANPKALFEVWKMDRTHGGTKMNLKKFGGPENGTEEDVEKLIKSATDKVIEENASVRKQLAEVKTTAGEALQLQAENEQLKKVIADRDEKEQAAQMKKLLDGAIAAGKFSPAERADWESTFKAVGAVRCERLLKNMAAVVPMGQRIGAGGDGEESTGARCEKIVRKIMEDDKVSYDVAFQKAYQRNAKLFQKRDNEQLAASRAGGNVYGGGDSE